MTPTHSEAAEAFVRRFADDHASSLLAWARRRFQDGRDAEEVVSETLAKAWRNYQQFDPSRGSERAWVFGILKTTAVDQFRRSRRHLRAVRIEDSDPDPDDLPIDSLADSSLVRDALSSLSDHHRDVIVAAYFGGLSVAEMSSRFAIPDGTVKSRLYYGMRALRGALEERGVLA
jgi:RNA polymerase sigma-70 factor (ECF subfamily)